MPFGESLKKLRTDRNISATQLAKKIGINSQTIYQWEWGIAEPRLSFLIWIADALEVSLDELVGRTVPSNEV